MDKRTLIVADDVLANRMILKTIFEEQYAVLEAKDGEEAIQLLEQNRDDVALLFLDLVMPKKTGLDVLEYMSAAGMMDTIPVIMITGEATNSTDMKAYEMGVSDIIYKPFDSMIVMRRTRNLIDLFKHRENLEGLLAERTTELQHYAEELQQRTIELENSRRQLRMNNEFLVNALSSVVEFRSLESGEHIQRVKYFTKLLLKHLRVMYPEYGITDAQAQLIINASTLHDIGKIGIPDNILLKPARLTPDEFEVMKTHTTIGCEILEKFKQEDNEFYRYCYEICRYHHERYDGGGYPDQISGEDIPIWAQIVSLADVFDALVSERVYKMPYPAEESARMIFSGECGEFSPKILDCFSAAKLEFYKAADINFSYVGLSDD